MTESKRPCVNALSDVESVTFTTDNLGKDSIEVRLTYGTTYRIKGRLEVIKPKDR